MWDHDRLAAQIKARAKTLGFDLCGITPAAALREAAGYRSWLARHMQGTMGYMERNQESRLDIRNWHPKARSVILLATSYRKEVPAGDPAKEGRIARYALTADYQRTIGMRLKAFAAWVRTAAPGSETRPFVDTAPVLERLYARYAGLGWVGKNTMVISPKIGSFFFLSGISTDLELAYDDPVPDHCGTCNRCLESCPTGAFPEPRVLDASRCIAYLTIEHRGAIAQPLRRRTGNWVFGCDLCQDVCPWNRFSRESGGEKLIEGLISLEEAARMDEEEFRRRMKATPVSRATRQGFVRNALLAMGNSGNPGFTAILGEFSAHADPVLKEQARWSLNRLREAVPA
jgi:epoxyqueuosine reductase